MKFLSLFSTALLLGVLPFAANAQAPAAPAQAPQASPGDLSQYTTADALWQHIEDVKKGPKTRPTTAQEYQAAITSMVSQVYAGATEFVKRYPDDQRKWEARLLAIETGSTLDRIAGRQGEGLAVAQLKDLAARQDAPDAVRAKARYELLGFALRAYLQGDKSVTADSILAQFKEFETDFPTYPSLDVLKYKLAQTLNASDPAAAQALTQELAASGQGRVEDQARAELARAEKLKSPLDLHFTAVTGAPVDISTMRGKVVLVDFWATWCGPCRAELPHVIDAYNKLHDKGFEVVGISLDQDKGSLLKFIAENGMPWPQYFDGKGWQNDISSGFGIESIPTMWLVNKKGYVVTTDGRTDLEGQVEKLLAE